MNKPFFTSIRRDQLKSVKYRQMLHYTESTVNRITYFF